jgi:hypothetical protein
MGNHFARVSCFYFLSLPLRIIRHAALYSVYYFACVLMRSSAVVPTSTSHGFPLSSMKKFLDTRSPNDPNLTLLDFIVVMLVENGESSVLFFDEDMPSLFRGTFKISTEMCEAQLHLLQHGVIRVKTELQAISEDEKKASQKEYDAQLQLWATKRQHLEDSLVQTSSVLMGREDVREQEREPMGGKQPDVSLSSNVTRKAPVIATSKGFVADPNIISPDLSPNPRAAAEPFAPNPRASLLAGIRANQAAIPEPSPSSDPNPRASLLAGIRAKQIPDVDPSSNSRASLLAGIRAKQSPTVEGGGMKNLLKQIQKVERRFPLPPSLPPPPSPPSSTPLPAPFYIDIYEGMHRISLLKGTGSGGNSGKFPQRDHTRDRQLHKRTDSELQHELSLCSSGLLALVKPTPPKYVPSIMAGKFLNFVPRAESALAKVVKGMGTLQHLETQLGEYFAEKIGDKENGSMQQVMRYCLSLMLA